MIVDFAPYMGKKLTVRATNMWTDKAYEGMDKIMQFRVGKTVSNNDGNAPLPKRFDVNIRFPVDRISATREFKLVSHMDMMWGINSYHMDDTMKRILMRPPLGTIEKYVFRSDGMGMSGGMGGMNGGSSTSSGGNMMGGNSGMTGQHGGNMGGSSSSTQSSHGGSPSPSNSNMMGGHSGMTVQSGGMMQGNSSSTHSSHHGGGMMGMMKRSYLRFLDLTANQNGILESSSGVSNTGSWSRIKRLLRRQMDGMMSGHGNMTSMMGGKGSMNSMMGNGTMMQMGGFWTHAMHLHLVVRSLNLRTCNDLAHYSKDMKVLSRTRDNTKKPDGRDYLEDYEKDAIKDVVLLGSNERIEVLVKFVPYSGIYML
jgi:hypothetical protein